MTTGVSPPGLLCSSSRQKHGSGSESCFSASVWCLPFRLKLHGPQGTSGDHERPGSRPFPVNSGIVVGQEGQGRESTALLGTAVWLPEAPKHRASEPLLTARVHEPGPGFPSSKMSEKWGKYKKHVLDIRHQATKNNDSRGGNKQGGHRGCPGLRPESVSRPRRRGAGPRRRGSRDVRR